MPKLWDQTIEAHRHAVREATLDITAELVRKHGLRSVTMSQVAETTGIGRATLYKYFPDVEAILLAWHERQIALHLDQLAAIRQQAAGSGSELAAVLEAYAFRARHSHGHHDPALVSFLHRSEHGARRHALHRVTDMLREMIADATAQGTVRTDVSPTELADYCLSALSAASNLSSEAAIRRLVTVVLAGLAPPAKP